MIDLIWLVYVLFCGLGIGFGALYGYRRGFKAGRDRCLRMMWDEFEIKKQYIYSPSAREVLVRGEKRMEGKITAENSHLYWEGVMKEREKANAERSV